MVLASACCGCSLCLVLFSVIGCLIGILLLFSSDTRMKRLESFQHSTQLYNNIDWHHYEHHQFSVQISSTLKQTSNQLTTSESYSLSPNFVNSSSGQKSFQYSTTNAVPLYRDQYVIMNSVPLYRDLSHPFVTKHCLSFNLLSDDQHLLTATLPIFKKHFIAYMNDDDYPTPANSEFECMEQNGKFIQGLGCLITKKLVSLCIVMDLKRGVPSPFKYRDADGHTYNIAGCAYDEHDNKFSYGKYETLDPELIEEEQSLSHFDGSITLIDRQDSTLIWMAETKNTGDFGWSQTAKRILGLIILIISLLPIPFFIGTTWLIWRCIKRTWYKLKNIFSSNNQQHSEHAASQNIHTKTD